MTEIDRETIRNIQNHNKSLNLHKCIVCRKEFNASDEDNLVDEGYVCSAKCYKKLPGWRKTIENIHKEYPEFIKF